MHTACITEAVLFLEYPVSLRGTLTLKVVPAIYIPHIKKPVIT